MQYVLAIYACFIDLMLAMAAAEACRVHKLATADAVIFATARAHAAHILTCDAHFDGLPGVTLILKPIP